MRRIWRATLFVLLGAVGGRAICPAFQGPEPGAEWERIPSLPAQMGKENPLLSSPHDDINEKRRYVFRTCTTPGTISLTFDEGPSVYTHDLLDILKKHGIHAGFHLDPFKIQPEDVPLVNRIVKEDHVLEMVVIKRLKDLSDAEAEGEIHAAYEQFKKATGYVPLTVRLSREGYLLRDIKTTLKLGLFVTEPTLDTEDIENPNFFPHLLNAVSNLNPQIDSVILVQRDRFGNSIRQLEKIVKMAREFNFRIISYELCCSESEVQATPVPKEARDGGAGGVLKSMEVEDRCSGSSALATPFPLLFLLLSLFN